MQTKIRSIVKPPRPWGNEPVDFACFRRSRLTTDAEFFQKRINEFERLQASTDPIKDYRNSFYFQFPCEFDGLATVKEFFDQGPIRSVDLMELISPHVDFAGRNVLSLGCNNGAEVFWLYSNTGSKSIHAVDENPNFEAYVDFLATSFALKDRIRFIRDDALQFLDKTNDTFDVIICHGLLYMMWDPLLFLRAVRDRLSPGGICSIEIFIRKGKRPVMEFLGDGTGWGDTFGFSPTFLEKILPLYGLEIKKRLGYRGRQVYLVRNVGG